MNTIVTVIVVIAIIAAAFWLWIYRGPEAYAEAMRQAEREDIAYYQAHPDCTLEEAHRHREAVRRRFGRR